MPLCVFEKVTMNNESFITTNVKKYINLFPFGKKVFLFENMEKSRHIHSVVKICYIIRQTRFILNYNMLCNIYSTKELQNFTNPTLYLKKNTFSTTSFRGPLLVRNGSAIYHIAAPRRLCDVAHWESSNHFLTVSIPKATIQKSLTRALVVYTQNVTVLRIS